MSTTIGPLRIEPTFHLERSEMTLEDVHRTFEKYYYIADPKLIDLVLAVKINLRLSGVPLWIFIVGKSGTGKTTLLRTLENSDDTETIYSLTSRTLVSGKAEIKEDLVKKFWGKLVLVFDLAKVMTVNPLEKAQIFAQFRDWYDGHLGGSYGTGKDVKYQGKAPQLLVGVTNAIYNEKIIHDKLGTRELLYRLEFQGDEEREDFKAKALLLTKNNLEEIAKRNCQEAVEEFLSTRKHMTNLVIPPEIEERIMGLTNELAILRATAEIDTYTGELKSDAEYENPSRCSQQFLQLYKALKTLDQHYPDSRFLQICEHIVESSADQITLKVYKFLKETTTTPSTNQVAKELKLGYKTVYSRLNLLWNIGVVQRELIPNESGGGSKKVWALSPSC